MGTTYNVIVPRLKKSDQANLKSQVDARLEAVNASMSAYQKNSSISRFNESVQTDWFAVSPGFALVTALRRAMRWICLLLKLRLLVTRIIW